MTTRQFRVGVVGCGVIAAAHVRYLRTVPGVTIVGVCDSDPSRLEAASRRFAIPSAYGALETLLAEARPEVVHVLTPPGPATGLVATALEAGCHVLTEKPMARTPEEAHRLVDIAARRGVTLGVDHSRLLHPSIEKARRMLGNGSLGDLVAVDIVQGFTRAFPPGAPPPGRPTPWSYAYPWGIFHNLVPHCLYYARAFAGDPIRLSVDAWTKGIVPESAFDEMTVTIEGSRAQARILLTLCSAPERNTVTLRGARRTVTVDTNLVSTLLVQDRPLPSMLAKNVALLDPAWQLAASAGRNTLAYLAGRIRSYPDIRNTLHAFYGALRGQNDPPASGEDGLAVVTLMEQVRLAAERSLAGRGHARDSQ